MSMLLSWLGTVGAVGAAIYAAKQARAATESATEARKQTMIAETAAQESARQSEAAQRSADASEEANLLAQMFIRFEPRQTTEGSGLYVFTNMGNRTATRVTLTCKNGERHWVDQPLVLAPEDDSPAVKIGPVNWPVTITFAEPPGSAEVAKPPRSYKTSAF